MVVRQFDILRILIRNLPNFPCPERGKEETDKCYKGLLSQDLVRFIANGTFPATIFLKAQRGAGTVPQGGFVLPHQSDRLKLMERLSEVLIVQRFMNLSLRRRIDENRNHELWPQFNIAAVPAVRWLCIFFGD
jgi:hypothetical protein